jgi:hypothetical protein
VPGFVISTESSPYLRAEPSDRGGQETFGDTIRILIVIHMLMVAAMLAGPKQYGILKRSGSEKNGEEPHNPVFKAHT